MDTGLAVIREAAVRDGRRICSVVAHVAELHTVAAVALDLNIIHIGHISNQTVMAVIADAAVRMDADTPSIYTSIGCIVADKMAVFIF